MKPSSRWTPVILLAPALLLFTFVVLVPMLGTVALSFVRWSGTNTMRFIGFDNYVRAFGDSVYRLSYRNTFVYIVLTLLLEVAAGFILAGLVSAKGKRTGWYRITFFIPVMLPMVAIAVLWSFVYSGDAGLLNGMLDAVGLDQFSQVWLGNPSTALIAVSVVSGWINAGFYMAIFYAGLQRIPSYLLEAAALDGANERQIFWKIKAPLLRGMTEVAILLCITGGIQTFDLFYVMTGGGPDHSTEVITTYIVTTVFRDHDVGYGAALAVIMTVLVMVIGVLFTRLRRKDVDLEY